MCNFSFIESIYIGLHIQNILLRDEKVIITNRVVTPILFKLNIGLYELFEKKTSIVSSNVDETNKTDLCSKKSRVSFYPYC